MAKAVFNKVKISGVVTVVPTHQIDIESEMDYYDDDSKIQRLKEIVGIRTRRIVSPKTTPADLCEVAARRLIEGMRVDVSTIDAIICVLDFPDYKCPPTSFVLHGKLELPETCMAFDITHGCAGYVYGLHVASSLIESGACRKVLMLVGDTKTRTIDIRDRVCAPLFGDGAAATLIEFDETAERSWFVLGAVGKQFDKIIIPAGGARLPLSEDTAREIRDERGNVRTLENFTMNGGDVFKFTISKVPHNIKEVFTLSELSPDDIDFAIFHQANKSIIENIASRVGFKDLNKVPSKTLTRFGNLAVASVPSVLNEQLSSELNTSKKRILMCGYGVGLAYASAILTLDNIYCPEPFEVEGL